MQVDEAPPPLAPELADLPTTRPAREPRVPRQVTRLRSGIRQLSLFGADARRPEAADLSGLLAGPGQIVPMGGTARVSIVVDEPWRAGVLIGELGRRGLHATYVDLRARRPPVRELTPVADPEAEEETTKPADPPEESEEEEPRPPAFEVRTAYSTMLVGLARSWLRGAVKTPPEGLLLDGRALRLWVAASGRLEGPSAYLLALGRADEEAWSAVGTALTGVGLRAELTGTRAGQPAYRISGQRRVARLAELVGEAPKQAPPGRWPS